MKATAVQDEEYGILLIYYDYARSFSFHRFAFVLVECLLLMPRTRVESELFFTLAFSVSHVVRNDAVTHMRGYTREKKKEAVNGVLHSKYSTFLHTEKIHVFFSPITYNTL